MSEIPFYPDENLQRLAERDLRDRVRDLESELERIRPVYEAACAWADATTWTDEERLGGAVKAAVDVARAPR
ncbi:MAG TPA: hypothetical protein VFO62_10530 [Candidatus Binatia bacterium]|nr:hypothetical protein [Candidatus Binatia bacterium]